MLSTIIQIYGNWCLRKPVYEEAGEPVYVMEHWSDWIAGKLGGFGL